MPLHGKKRLLAELLVERERVLGAVNQGYAVPGSELPWRVWVAKYFPSLCDKPFAERHVRLWEWFDGLERGVRPPPRVEVWPRGGGKSTSGEGGVTRVGEKLTRRYALYVSETQEQADKHVQAIGSLFERRGIGRSVNKFGTSKGWRRDQLRTENGFNVSAYGLDTAARGVKLDEYRPDLIIFDDIDATDDNEKATQKKIDAITKAIIPAGSSDVALLFLQNLIIEDGVFGQLVDDRADFLHDREPAFVDPAVRELRTVQETQPDGRVLYRIVGGTATWEGQSLAICEAQINAWGLRAFEQEAQHEVRGVNGLFFDVNQLRYCSLDDVPWKELKFLVRAWDLAATEGGGDWTIGSLHGLTRAGVEYVIDVKRVQYGSDKVRSLLLRTAQEDASAYPVPVRIHLPQDPGQAGKDQAVQLAKLLSGYSVKTEPVSGKKAVRARGWQTQVNSGNAVLVRGEWNKPFREVHRRFAEDELDQQDDDVDAASDAHNELAGLRQATYAASPVVQKPAFGGYTPR